MSIVHTEHFNTFADRINPRLFNEYNSIRDIIGLLPMCTKDGPWIAGGLLRRFVIGKDDPKIFQQGDVDFFFKDNQQFLEFKSEMLRKCNASLMREEEHVAEFQGRLFDGIPIKVQAVKLAFYNSPAELINDFDYTPCMAAYDGTDIHYGQWFLWDNARMRLAVNKIKYPVASLRRLVKYTGQGYYACQGCIQEIAEKIHTMDPIDFRNRQVTYVD